MRADQQHNANAETNSDFDCVRVCVSLLLMKQLNYST